MARRTAPAGRDGTSHEHAAGGRSPLAAVAHLVAEAVRDSGARVLCFRCLAAQQGLSEHDVRAVALVLLARAGFELVRRACASCQRVEGVLVAQEVA